MKNATRLGRLLAVQLALALVLAGCTGETEEPPATATPVVTDPVEATITSGDELDFTVRSVNIRGQQVPFDEGMTTVLSGTSPLLVTASGPQGQQLAAITLSPDGVVEPAVSIDYHSTAFTILATMPELMSSEPLWLAALRGAAGRSEHFDALADAVRDQDGPRARLEALKLAAQVTATLTDEGATAAAAHTAQTTRNLPSQDTVAISQVSNSERASSITHTLDRNAAVPTAGLDLCRERVLVAYSVCFDVEHAVEGQDVSTVPLLNDGRAWSVLLGTQTWLPYAAVAPRLAGGFTATDWLTNAAKWVLGAPTDLVCDGLDWLDENTAGTSFVCPDAIAELVADLADEIGDMHWDESGATVAIVPGTERENDMVLVSSGDRDPTGHLGSDPSTLAAVALTQVAVEVLNAYSMGVQPLVELATGLGRSAPDGGAELERAGQLQDLWATLTDELSEAELDQLATNVRGAADVEGWVGALRVLQDAVMKMDTLKAVAQFVLEVTVNVGVQEALSVGLDAVIESLIKKGSYAVPILGEALLLLDSASLVAGMTVNGIGYLQQRSANPPWVLVRSPWRKEQPVSVEQVLGAPVPAVCGQGAGTLVDGRLPGDVVTIALGDDGQPAAGQIALGDVQGGGPVDAAVALWCDPGTGPLRQVVALYGPGPTVLGVYDLAGVADGGDAQVHSLTIAEQAVHVQFSELLGEGFATGNAITDGELDLTVREGTVVADNVHLFEVQDAAQAFADALVNGDQVTVAAMVPDEAIREQIVTGLTDFIPTLGQCTYQEFATACVLVDARSLEFQVGSLGMLRVGYRSWNVTEWYGVDLY